MGLQRCPPKLGCQWVEFFCRSKGFHLKKKINMIRLMFLAVLVTMAVAGPYYLYPGYSHLQVAIAPSLTYAYVPGVLGNVGTYSGLVNVVKRSPEEEGEAEPEPESEPEPSD